MLFDNYHIPRDNLLNKSADVTPQGDYETPYKVTHISCMYMFMYHMPLYVFYIVMNPIMAFLMGILL